MRVFNKAPIQPVQKNNESQAARVDGQPNRKRPPRKPLSSEQIRAKVANHFAQKDQSKKVAVSDAPPKGLYENGQSAPTHVEQLKTKTKQRMQLVAKEMMEGQALERPSDVGLNDPNDPATIGKLKDLLNAGAIQFSEKERSVLSEILEA